MPRHLLFIIFFAASACICRAGDIVLGEAQVKTGATKVQVVLSEPGKLSLKFGAGPAVPIETKPLSNTDRIHALYPLRETALEIRGAEGALLSFGIEDGQGAARLITAALIADSSGVKIAQEWSVECGPLGALGVRRENQQFESAVPDQLIRRTRKLAIEGVEARLDCGCSVCSSRTLELAETETYQWKKESGRFERVALERRYVVQPGEGLMAVARKALGDARLMSRILRLNPGLKNETVLQPGQQLLIEKQ